ncbi:MAG TPA: polyprenyl synthetase family protein [Pyrinomonadaceae bacterium]|nr:polyprenyl synthetase family protein [Pyrinomonadaceae bacterium]
MTLNTGAGARTAGAVEESAPRVVKEAAEGLSGYLLRERGAIDDALRACLPTSSLADARRLNEAVEYAVFPGGKRLRPALALLASNLAGAARAQSLRVACAVEFLHSSSLVLDDLPAMDDADMRRSRRALHLVFGEGAAVLASVALLNRAYELLAAAARGRGAAAALVAEAARCVGADGMVGGQAVDLEARAGAAGPDALACRDLKTVALMRLMMTAGALARGAPEEDASALADFGECFGRAYQVCDDLLDEAGGPEATGKPSRQDERHARASAVSTLGGDVARRLASELIERGRSRLAERFGPRAEVGLLSEAAELVLNRAGIRIEAEGRRPEPPIRRGRAAARGRVLSHRA